MNQRPKKTDTMADVLKMQNDYLKEKNDENFVPAVETIKLSEPKQSVFAKRRNLKQTEEDENQPKASSVIGEVVERKYGVDSVESDIKTEISCEDQGFPKPSAIDVRSFDTKQGKSIFSQMVKKQTEDEHMDMETENAVPESSAIDENLHSSLHQENLAFISGLSKEDILEEQAKLLKTMDPKLVDFVRSKRKSNDLQKESTPPQKSSKGQLKTPIDLPVLDFLKDEQSKSWLHFDVLEPEKLEWTKNIEKTIASLKPGESYEARFDWKGFLLPFVANESQPPSEPVNDDRELYLHGEDAHRPGYSLQEFFRLARSTVLQQRVAAINAIAGILNIFNQGYYDGILELPISKIFFFLRFAMDENTPVIVEVSSRALSYLFYNDTDETLLDIAFETKGGIIQPIMDNRRSSVAGIGQDETEADLESSLKNLSLGEGRKMFESKIEDLVDDEQEKESVNDFHLAEVNLIECLMRSNILERISYILTVTKPKDITVNSCVKILIRLARTSRDFALTILNKKNLVEQMITEFLSKMESQREPQFIVLKLFRILASYDRTFCLNLKNSKVLDIVKDYVCTKTDVNVGRLKVQIESFRFLRLYFYFFPDESTYGDLIMPIRYLLEWHYQQLNFQQDNHFIIRQHASALMYLLSCGNIVVTFPVFSEIFKMCCCKWFTMATREGTKEFSQKLLLSTMLDVAGPFVKFSPGFFYDFTDDYLMKFLKSSHYQQMAKKLCTSSPFFRVFEDRCNVHKPLINLGSIVRRHKKSAPSLVLSQDYSIYFMDSLLLFIDAFDNMNNTKNYDFHHKLCEIFYTEDIEKYLEGFSTQFNRNLSTNWFLKIEINFIYHLLKARSLQFNPWLLKVAFNLLNCLTQENLDKICHIFKTFVFNDRYYFANDVTEKEFERWKYIYSGVVMSKLGPENINLLITKSTAIAESWNQIMLNESWPYSLLLILLYNVEVDSSLKRIVETELKEDEIIMTTLKFTLLLEKNKIHLITTGQHLMYIMLVYFGKDLNFLDPSVKLLIKEKLKAMKNFPFPHKFNMKLNKEKSFESLYTMFLDTFQSNSYGDNLFSILVMIPLAQKYDSKWRKLIWSEYVATTKFINCQESDLLDNFSEYISPVETDQSLLKCYATALTSNLLRKGSITWKIAEYHVKNAKKSD